MDLSADDRADLQRVRDVADGGCRSGREGKVRRANTTAQALCPGDHVGVARQDGKGTFHCGGREVSGISACRGADRAGTGGNKVHLRAVNNRADRLIG